MESIIVRDDSSERFSIRRVDEVDLGELAERDEELEQIFVSERLDVGEVVVDVARSISGSTLVRVMYQKLMPAPTL